MINELKNYPKIRLILIVSFLILWIFVCLNALSMGFSFINWFPVLVLFFGSFLFALNKRQSDIISSIVFSGSIFYLIANLYTSYTRREMETGFIDYAIWQLSIDKIEFFGLSILFLASIYLLVRLYTAKFKYL